MSAQLQVTGEAKIRDIQGPVVANDGVVTALDGAASQYVRGDGTLADFPTSSGGGSSVSYYLNSSVSQGTIGGVAYRELSKDPIIGTGTDIAISSNGYVANYITDVNDPDVTIVPGGNFNCEFYFSVSNDTGNPFTYAELYKYDGTTFTLLGTSVGVPEYINQGTIIAPYYFAIPVPTSALALTDRLAIRIYVNVDGRTVTLHTENSHLCQVVTTLSKGMVSLNNLTDQSQFLTTGTAGTNFAISSTGDTHTFNLPVASATNTGKLSSTDWTTFNNKQNAITDPITGTGASTQIAYFNSGTSITSEAAFNYDASTNRLGVNTSVPNATIGANAGIDSGYSLLLKNDNANYNGIGFGIDSTYGNLISTEKQGTALTRNLTLLNQSGFVSLTEAGNLGVGLLTPNTGLDIYNGTSAYLWLHTATSGTSGTDGVRLALFNTNGANLRNFEGSFSITAEGDFSVITLGAENFKINSSDGSIYQSKVANAMLKSVSGVITAAVAGTDYLAPASISGTTNTLAKFTSSSAIGNSNITDTGSLITLGSTTSISSGNLGVGTASPSVSGVGIDIYSATTAGLRLHNAASGTTVSDGAGINFSAGLNLGITNYEAGAIDIVTNGNSGVYIASTGLVGINGATPSVALTVNGAISQTSVTSSLLKTDSIGLLVAAVAGTDYVAPSALSSYVPTSRTLTINGTTYDLSANRSWTITTGVTGSGTTDYLPKFTGSTSIGNSAITDDGTTVTLISRVLAAPRARLNNGYDNASLILNVGGQTYMDSRTSRLYQTYNLSSMSNYMHVYDPYSSVNANGGFSIGASSSITTLPSTSIIHFDGVNNRVGIGTTAPSATLSVNGASYFSSSVTIASGNFLLGGTSRLLYSNGSTVNNIYSGGSDGLRVMNQADSAILVTIANTGAATFSSSVGVNGVTPVAELQVGKASDVTFALSNSSSVTSGNRGSISWYNSSVSTVANIKAVAVTDNVGTELQFYTRPAAGSLTQNMTITSGGNVGIGTSSPTAIGGYGGLTLSGVDGSYIDIRFNNSDSGRFFTNSNTAIGFECFNTNPIVFKTNSGSGATERMRITSGGAVYVGQTSSSAAGAGGKMQVATDLLTTGSSAGYFWENRSGGVTSNSNWYGWYTTGGTIFLYNGAANAASISPSTGVYTPLSDVNKKKDFEASTIGLDAILSLKPTLYRMKSDNTQGEKELGFIAQEVKEFIPQAYVESGEDENKFIGLNYNAIVAALVKSVQELKAEIDELKNK